MTGDLSKNDTRIRTFIAVSLPPQEKAAIAPLESRFAAHGSILKWVESSLLHITIRFLGNVAAQRLPEVMAAARQAAGQTHPFSLQFDGIGAFPNVRSPRVIWLDLKENAGREALGALAARTEDVLEEWGFPREGRSFRPHITLARVRESAGLEARRALGETVSALRADRLTSHPFTVDSLVVMRSDLFRSGPRYTPLAVAEFA